MKFKLTYILILLIFSSCAFEDPYFMTISVSNCSGITIENKFASIEEIPIAVYLKTKDLDSVQKTKFFVKLKIAKDANMGEINFVVNEIRKAEIFNVRYYTVGNSICGY